MILIVSLVVLEALRPRAEAGQVCYSTYLDSFTQSGHVPYFDTSLGTLQRVEYSAAAEGSVGIYYWPPDEIQKGTALTTLGFMFATPLPFGYAETQAVVSFSSDLGNPGFATIPLGANVTWSTTDDLSPFMADPVPLRHDQRLDCRWADRVLSPMLDFWGYSSTGTLNGFLTITYYYSTASVPEPSSLALASVGFAGLLGYGR